MAYLLDTHTFLWFINGDTDLSQTAQKCIENNNEEKYISIASFWEIAIKRSLGKLALNMPFKELEQHIYMNGFEIIPITIEHTSCLTELPFHHRDPFDRIIIAQALTENLIVLSKDSSFRHYRQLNQVW